MNLTRSYTIKLIKIATVSVFVLIIIIYAVWRSLNYVRGPSIIIDSPQKNGAGISKNTVEIKGHVERVVQITLNSRPIPVDEQGNFDEIIALFPGQNFLTFKARDQFGRDTQKIVQVIGVR